MARKRLSGSHPKRAYYIVWHEEYPPHEVTASQYRNWLGKGAIIEIEPRKAVLDSRYTFLFHEDAGAVIVPRALDPSIPSFWRIVERFALYDTRGPALTPQQIRLWIWQEYR